VFCVAAGAAPLLIVSDACAQSRQLLDPGWQLGYPVSPSNGGGGAVMNGGVLQYMFGNGGGQPVIQRAYQPASVYYQTVPAPQARRYQAAPMYYQVVAAPQARGYQAAPMYYQVVAAPQTRGYQAAPTYYQVVSAPQARAYQPAPVYYQSVSAPQPRGFHTAPTYYQVVSPQQPRAYQPAPVYYQPVAAPQQSAYQVPPASYQPSAAPQQTAYQALPVSIHQLPASQQIAEPPAPLNQRLARAAQQDAGQSQQAQPEPPPQLDMARIDPVPGYAPSTAGDMMHAPVDPKYDRQIVDYKTDEPPGTIVIDTPHYFLYLVMEGGKALRYGIGVGRPGFTWAGMKEVSAMREWPDWYPPDEMMKRRPDLPKYMAGGPNNPLGSRALYLGSTLYRIHGSNEPWTIGTQVSSGCIRLRNEDVIDLYGRVKVGTKVLVI
jgi:lipoprotein-anchoring transpeptidase ErfK/SrfK